MQSQTFENTYLYLKTKYRNFFVNKEITAHEMHIEVPTMDIRVRTNMNIPPYLKIGNSTNSKVIITLIDLASYLSESPVLSQIDRREYIYQYFTNKYPRLVISKKEFADELSVCSNTLGTYIQKKYICKVSRQGTAHNSKITININDIADYFSRVVQTM